MKFIFLLALFFLYLSLILIKKTRKKENLIVAILYICGIIYFLNLIISIFLSYLGINNTLLVFSCIYLILIFIIFYFYRRKNKKISFQSYYLNKKELIILIILIFMCLAIGIVRYSYKFNYVNYEIGDSAVHYKMSLEYSNYEKIFFQYHKNEVIDYNYPMFGYYVNCGIFMKIMPFSSIVSYNLFNTLILCLIACCFYATLLKIKKKEGKNILSLTFVVLYTLAYPLNYMLFGFGYLGIGIIAVNLIILTFNYLSEYNNKVLYILLFIFNFGLFSSYYLFIPIIYISEFIYLLYYLKNKKVGSKKIIKILFFCLFIPLLFGYYFFIGHSSVSNNLKNFSIVGESYQNLVGNFILLIPLLCHSINKQAKSNNLDFDLIFLICLLLYIVITFILVGTGLISSYYYYKVYYILWLIVYLFVYKLTNYDEYNVTIKIGYIFVIVVLFFSFYDIEKCVNKVNKDFRYSGVFSKLSDIYIYNYNCIKKPTIHITPDKVKLMSKISKFSKECILYDKTVDRPYIASYYHKFWFFQISEHLPSMKYIYYLEAYGTDLSKDIIELDFNSKNNTGVTDYIIDDKNYSAFLEYDNECIIVENESIGDLEEYNFNNDYDVLYENKAGKLYKKK